MRSKLFCKAVAISSISLGLLASPASADNETFTPDPPVAGPVTITSTNDWNGCPRGTVSWTYEHTVYVFPAAGGTAVAQYVTINESGTGSAAQTLSGSDTHTLPAGDYTYRYSSLIKCDDNTAVRDGAPVNFTVAEDASVPVVDPTIGFASLIGIGAISVATKKARKKLSA